MSLKKHFLHTSTKSLNISKFKLIAGIIIGLLYSFIIYAFLYMTRETLRISSINENYDYLILSDSVVNYYNLLYAFIALLFGQSICFSFWLEKPKNFREKKQLKNKIMLHDQRFLNLYFLSWVSKLSFLFWAFIISFGRGYYVFSFYPNYSYLFILFIVVLYLQTWQNIRLTFKNASLKWLLISVIIISIFSYGMSKINIINYKAVNNIIAKNNYLYNFNLKLPESSIYQKFSRKNLTINIYVAQTKNKINEEKPVFFINRKKVRLKDIGYIIKNIQDIKNEFEIPYMLYRLHIHKDIKMKYINALKEELSKVGASRIGYSVVPKNLKYDLKYYTNLSFNFRMTIYDKGFFNFKDAYKRINKSENIISVKQLKNNIFLIDNKAYNTLDVQKILKEKIDKNLNYIVKFYINDTSEFSNYLNFLITLKKSINNLRDEYAQKKYSKSFNEVDRLKEREIKQKIPFIFIELTSEMLKEVNE